MSENNVPAVVFPQGPRELIVPISSVGWLSQAGNHICTSLDMSKKADKRLLYKHLQSECESKDSWINKDFRVVHVTNHPASGVDPDTGEVHSYRRTVLHLQDGQMVAFGSAGIDKSVALLQALEGPAPWPEGLHVVLRQTKTKSGGIWLFLESLEQDEVIERGGKKK